mgnify:CR=1 FL=1
MVSYIQNETQSTLNAFNSVMQQLIDDDNKKLEGNYNHLPVMQFVLLEKYNVVLQQATALNALLRTGIPKEVALPMCGFDKNLELNELKDLSNGQTNNSGNSNNENEEDGEEKNRRTSTVKKLHA